MKKAVVRTEIRRDLSQDDFVALWSAAMWGLAAVYLLATFSPY